MANEVVIEEYGSFTCKYEDGSYAPVIGDFITSQVIDVGSISEALDARTKVIMIHDAGGLGFWYKTGASDVSAAANTSGNRYMPAGGGLHSVGVSGFTHIDTAAVI